MDSVVMTGADLRRWRRQVGLSQAELARRLGYSNHTVCHWELGGKRVPPAHYRRILEELLKAKREREELRLMLKQLADRRESDRDVLHADLGADLVDPRAAGERPR